MNKYLTKQFNNNCFELNYIIKGNEAIYFWKYIYIDDEGYIQKIIRKEQKAELKNDKFEAIFIEPFYEDKIYVVDING
jgi:hypothetical protein